ncbi:MAG: hypothetical protein ACK46X_18515 [Candidatus Sericytochromatia bacterium]
MSTGTASAYGHPKLNELIQKAASTPFIGQVLISTIKDLVHPQDRILVCYYQIETSGATADREFTYYSVDVVLVTTAFFIRINFYPKTHTYVKKRIHSISDMKIEYPAPPLEDVADLKTADFVPSRMSLAFSFADAASKPVETWTASSGDEAQVRQLMEISRLLGRVVGMPLAQAQPATPAAG